MYMYICIYIYIHVAPRIMSLLMISMDFLMILPTSVNRYVNKQRWIFLKRSYEGDGLKSVRGLKHQILVISYIDLVEEMASKA